MIFPGTLILPRSSKTGSRNRRPNGGNTVNGTLQGQKEMKADEYRYWQSRPVYEQMDAVAEITLATYAMKGAAPDVPRLQRPLVRLPRPQRKKNPPEPSGPSQ
jgi:hypothetical protein